MSVSPHLTRGCSSQCSQCDTGVNRRKLSLVLRSYSVEHPAVPPQPCTAVRTNELHTDCSSSESTSSSHKELQMSNGVSVMKINSLSFDFLFVFLNRLLRCICCNNTISSGPSYLVSRGKYIALCGNVLQRQIFFGERKGKSDGQKKL